jgi:hypothetical protein
MQGPKTIWNSFLVSNLNHWGKTYSVGACTLFTHGLLQFKHAPATGLTFCGVSSGAYFVFLGLQIQSYRIYRGILLLHQGTVRYNHFLGAIWLN